MAKLLLEAVAVLPNDATTRPTGFRAADIWLARSRPLTAYGWTSSSQR